MLNFCPTAVMGPRLLASSLRSSIWFKCPVRAYSKGKFVSSKNKKNKMQTLKPLNFVIPNYTSVNNLANMLNIKLDKLVKDLKDLGFTNARTDFILSKDYIQLILQEYNYDVPSSSGSSTNSGNVYNALKVSLNPRNLAERPPVVTIMGHVDHGKTTILDYLRNSSLVDKESGGITQHIGAFQVVTPVSKRKITFLDTPGHAAFLKMRQRGANITDIIVLVISVEDSIMPQTIEAIKHVKKSGNELIVAITKIDKLSSQKKKDEAITRVTNDLLSHEIEVESIGGSVQVVSVSGKTGENMDLLEECIIALSDSMDLKAEYGRSTMIEGWILESEVQKALGNVATVLIRKGELQKGNILICGNTYCKVRAILDEHRNPIQNACPAQAVKVSGWKELPSAGDEVIQVSTEATAKKFVTKRLNLVKLEKEATTVEKLNNERTQTKELAEKNNYDDKERGEVDSPECKGPTKVNFILKADVSGSVEAIRESIGHLGNEEVVCNIVDSSVGMPTESDLRLARVSNSIILCFSLGNLPNDVLNNKEKVEVRQFDVIYKLIESVTETLIENMMPIYDCKQIATAEVREIFNFCLKQKSIRIAGCKVTNGKISRNSLVKVLRGAEDEVIFDGKLATLRQGKESPAEVTKGKECGITFENNFEGYEPGDKIIAYEKIKVQRYL
ncbi:translation initiation factor 2 Ecym_1337 [Eremothecium cymbalariae DBVPG|uniref:Translation initiation factor IF-2, mitochondrial n=1 Tax=Eremothecium cymbalariae (strain CBS 270.75 / DBVPG 7215 / KCTC 17166 / NRRL Y-17582) TaxID=931890 RepID=G8JNA7_ERECY|nr:hypothetical protein Ecym_1337 [Eremothecium cymbalariae DBVPG\